MSDIFRTETEVVKRIDELNILALRDGDWDVSRQYIEQAVCIFLYQNGHTRVADAYKRLPRRYPIYVADYFKRENS